MWSREYQGNWGLKPVSTIVPVVIIHPMPTDFGRKKKWVEVLPDDENSPILQIYSTSSFTCHCIISQKQFLSRIMAEASQLNIWWLVSSFCIKLCMDGRGLLKCHFDYVRHLPKSLQWCSTVFGMKSQGILIRHKSLIICLWWLTSFIAQHCHFVWMLKLFQMICRFPNFLWYFRSHSSPLVETPLSVPFLQTSKTLFRF